MKAVLVFNSRFYLYKETLNPKFFPVGFVDPGQAPCRFCELSRVQDAGSMCHAEDWST